MTLCINTSVHLKNGLSDFLELYGHVILSLKTSSQFRDKPCRFFCLLTSMRCFILSSDNTASVLTRRGSFLQRDQRVHFLPVVISDGSSPSLSSTNTLSVIVCTCDGAGNQQSCSQGASPLLVARLNTAATVAVLTCVLVLLGKT